MEELRSDDPRRIGAYRLLGRLGAGGMGRVYMARSDTGRTVAVRVVRPELAGRPEFRDRFRQEVHAARRVGGKWTAPVLDAGTEAPAPWVATGYIAGPSLQSVIDEHGPLPEHAVRTLAAGLAQALMDIHAAGLIHRALKPSNVLVTIDGPRVIDFGIARALETVADSDLTLIGAMAGSPGFMSPEQVRGEPLTVACDIFCLGSVLTYAASGKPPFGTADDSVHALMYRIAEQPPDLSALPEHLRDLATDCLAKNPARRPSPARVLARTGGGAASGEPWLPGSLVTRLGRRAVRLPEAGTPLPEDPGAGGPVATAPEEPPAPDPAAAEAGAPHAMPTEISAPSPPAAPPLPTAGSSGHPQRQQGGGAPHDEEPGPGQARQRPGRRTTVLTAVLAAVTLAVAGGVALPSLAHQKSEVGGDGRMDEQVEQARTSPGSTSGASAPAPAAPATPAGTLPASPPAGGIPRGYLGTWQTRFGKTGTDVRRFTLRQGSPSDTVFTMVADGTSYHCEFTAELKALGPPLELGPSTVTAGPPETCRPGPVTTLELTGEGTLRRTFADRSAPPLTYSRVG